MDGFPTLFFQKYWHVVGKEELQMKCHNLGLFCNVLYKIVAKRIANRLRKIPNVCIDEAQGVFVPRRKISDNIIIAYEWLHAFKKKQRGSRGSFALKMDMRLGDFFWPTRGLRQEDPLSPYLFIICVERVSSLLNLAKEEGSILGERVGRLGLIVTHLLFADNSILFGKASEEGASAMKAILLEYEGVSSQVVNIDKSLERIQDVLSVQLGLPTLTERSKKEGFVTFKERELQCAASSIGGKKVFIKSILQTILIYAIQCFLLPITLCRELKGIMSKFWWCNSRTKYISANGNYYACRNVMTGDFMSSRLRSYPSYTWRSIWGVRRLLENGCGWRVSSGDVINIWNDSWPLGPG
ncbi:reverse transcriptase [Gossypium australe]|uniref:Reverse transcriptase n=1 Tax=Gossypium australe TaxID=47621 RepID=A0A5B6VLC7_9ROSI|nr:reverse transcriptase [Gossypium australe]